MVRHRVHEAVDLLLGNHGAGGIVRIGDENLARPRGDGGGHGVEVMAETRVGHLDNAGIEELRHERVNGKSVARRNDFVAGPEEGVANELDDSFEPLPRMTFSRWKPNWPAMASRR